MHVGMVLTIRFPINGALVEGHDVLCERAGFVWEDVFDLTELFVERCGSSLSWRASSCVIHAPVPVDVVTVA